MIETELQELHPKICHMELKYSCHCNAGYIIRRQLI